MGSEPSPPLPPRYSIEVTRQAERDLGKLPKQAQKAAARWIDQLAEEPRPPQAKPLRGFPNLMRLRFGGDYRLIYAVADAMVLVTIVRAKHRSEVYRGL